MTVYLHNQTFAHRVKVSPHELYFGREWRKLDAKPEKCISAGYSHEQKGIQVL